MKNEIFVIQDGDCETIDCEDKDPPEQYRGIQVPGRGWLRTSTTSFPFQPY